MDHHLHDIQVAQAALFLPSCHTRFWSLWCFSFSLELLLLCVYRFLAFELYLGVEMGSEIALKT